MRTAAVTGKTPTLIGFRRHLRMAAVPGESAVYLVSARGTVALSGEQIGILAPLLDGTRTVREVQENAAPGLAPERLGQLLGALVAADLVTLRRAPSPGGDQAAEAYWDLAGADPDRLNGTAVRVTSLGGEGILDAGSATAALRATGVAAEEGPDRGHHLTLVLCDDYLNPGLRAINSQMLATGRAWMPAKPIGSELWIGPVFQPGGEGPCWSCLATRLRGQRPGEVLLRDLAGSAAVVAPEASLPATRALGLQLVAVEVAKWLAGATRVAWDAVRIFDTLTLEGRSHPVDRRPQCRDCGDPGLMAARTWEPVRPTSRRKATVAGNGHRALTERQVWDRYRRLADPITGITDGIHRDPRCPDFLHSYLSGTNRAMTGSMAGLRAGLRQQSGGKGRTDLEARVSALCESVERYCGSRFGDEPTIRAALRDLGEAAVHPDACQLFDRRQFAGRLAWNAANPGFQQVPEPFDETEELDWTPVWSLTHRRHRLVPTDLLYFTSRGHRSLRATSNGSAAGGSLEDAIVQGFLELVERDAVALWWYNRTRHPAVDLNSFPDPWLAELRVQYAELNREFWVLDLTADLGIPVMAAVSRRVDKPEEDLMLGFGAHFDPAVALRRALTELGQLLPAVIDTRPDGSGYDRADPHIQRWWRTATLANQPYLRPADHVVPRSRAGFHYNACADLGADVERIVALAARHDLEVLVLDQTRPDLGMPVVKVVIPGLRHFWARFAPGRLFDVPVQLGRLVAPTPYQELNPVPLFL